MNKYHLVLTLLFPVLTVMGQNKQDCKPRAIFASLPSDRQNTTLHAQNELVEDGRVSPAVLIKKEYQEQTFAFINIPAGSDPNHAALFSETASGNGVDPVLAIGTTAFRDKTDKYMELTHEGDVEGIRVGSLLSERPAASLASHQRSGTVALEATPLGLDEKAGFPMMAPLRYADKLYYASVENDNFIPTKDRRHPLKQHPVLRIYETKKGSTPRKVDINPRSVILNASNITIMPDASRLFYTLCSDESFGSQEECTIWYRNKMYSGEWGPPVKLPEQINQRNFTQTQPSVGYDWKLKKYVLFFVSNRPGGAGGQDVWCSVMENDDTFGEPFPMPFNTEKDERTPFFHQVSQTLFFSSDGLKGKGGFDVYQTKREADGIWSTPALLDGAVNTKDDELYYTYHTYSRRAYFVSNKPAAGSSSADARHFDVYESRVYVDFHLRVFDLLEKVPLNGAQVLVRDLEAEISESFELPAERHNIHLLLEPGKSYQLEIQMPGFESYSLPLSTEGISAYTEMDENVFLRKFAQP